MVFSAGIRVHAEPETAFTFRQNTWSRWARIRTEISVAQLAREHGVNDNLLFKWRQYWREGKLRPPSTTENNVPELLPITLDTEDVVPATSPRSQPVAAAAPESLNISCEVTFRHGSLRLNGAISENILNLLIRELKR
ncbi:TPA: transposase [Klebsiella pneumoniae]